MAAAAATSCCPGARASGLCRCPKVTNSGRGAALGSPGRWAPLPPGGDSAPPHTCAKAAGLLPAPPRRGPCWLSSAARGRAWFPCPESRSCRVQDVMCVRCSQPLAAAPWTPPNPGTHPSGPRQRGSSATRPSPAPGIRTLPGQEQRQQRPRGDRSSAQRHGQHPWWLLIARTVLPAAWRWGTTPRRHLPEPPVGPLEPPNTLWEEMFPK